MENYKAFRTQTELLMERRTTAISQQFHSPLMIAQQEMDLLKKKVERRDEIIRGLRLTMSTSATLMRQGESEEAKARIGMVNEPVRLQEIINALNDDVLSLQVILIPQPSSSPPSPIHFYSWSLS